MHLRAAVTLQQNMSTWGKSQARYSLLGLQVRHINRNYSRGTRKDFQRLLDLGIELEGKIAVAQYGGSNRGVKIKNAEVSFATAAWTMFLLTTFK
jgi:hypothetical protein